MNTTINAVKFKADPKLEKFINDKNNSRFSKRK